MNKNLEEISDGKRYGLNDMVRAACNDCAGCSSCCEDMGESIILDPLDIYELTKNLNTTFEKLIKGADRAACGRWHDIAESENDRQRCLSVFKREKMQHSQLSTGYLPCFSIGADLRGEQAGLFFYSGGLCQREPQ